MENIINILVENGTSVACLVYFMWYNNNTQKENNLLLNELKELIKLLGEKIDNLNNRKEG